MCPGSRSGLRTRTSELTADWTLVRFLSLALPFGSSLGASFSLVCLPGAWFAASFVPSFVWFR